MPTAPAQPTAPYQLFVGVDISARSFTASFIKGAAKAVASRTFEQSAAAFAQFQSWLLAQHSRPDQILVVMEATSTYWIKLASVLHQAGLVVSVVNPQQAHHFALALLKRAKSDELDAQTLAQLAQALQPPAWNPPPQLYHELHQRLAQRKSLLDLRTQLKNQLHSLQAEAYVVAVVVERMEQLIASLTAQVKTIDQELEAIVGADHQWGDSIRLLQSIPGIGLLTACLIVVTTLNFSRCDNVEAVTLYAGLAPLVHTSGSSVRGRPQIGHAGNATLRGALYMATLAAARHNPIIKAFYDKLRAAGKAMKVARCAAARKLLHLAYAIVKSGREFDPLYQPPKPAAMVQPIGA